MCSTSSRRSPKISRTRCTINCLRSMPTLRWLRERPRKTPAPIQWKTLPRRRSVDGHPALFRGFVGRGNTNVTPGDKPPRPWVVQPASFAEMMRLMVTHRQRCQANKRNFQGPMVVRDGGRARHCVMSLRPWPKVNFLHIPPRPIRRTLEPGRSPRTHPVGAILPHLRRLTASSVDGETDRHRVRRANLSCSPSLSKGVQDDPRQF